MNILLLEDYVGLNTAIKNTLSLENHIVESCEDGREALNFLDKKYDLYILDIKVPYVSGFEILEKVLENYPDANVIMMSAQTDIDSVEKAYDYGCIDYVRKPFHIQELRAKVKQIDMKHKTASPEYKLKSEDVQLTSREKRFLDLLFKYPKSIITYEKIATTVYNDKDMSMNALRALVRRLRTKLEDDLIENVLHEGYKKVSYKRRKTDAIGIVSESKISRLENENRKLKEENQLLVETVMIDPLTQLYNRIKIAKSFHYYKKEYVKHKVPFSMMMIDLDFFKQVNDTYSHHTGDAYLCHIAEILKDVFRSSDVIARWGGEEFLVLLPHTDLSAAKTLAEQLKKTISNKEFKDIGSQTASFGLTTFVPIDTIDTIVKRADNALYEVKNSGRNDIGVCE
jgi:two-component system, cell cycle response regulator